jgi:hypothetical protein
MSNAATVEAKQPVKRAQGGKQSVEAVREAAAKRIYQLSKAWGENSVALGREFAKVRDTFPQKGSSNGERRAANHAERPGWHEWIDANSVWSPRSVNNFIRVAEESAPASYPPL